MSGASGTVVAVVDAHEYEVSNRNLRRFHSEAGIGKGDLSDETVNAMLAGCKTQQDKVELFIFLLFVKDMRVSKVTQVSIQLGNDARSIAVHAARRKVTTESLAETRWSPKGSGKPSPRTT